MHAYATDTEDRKKVTAGLAVLSVAVAAGLGGLVEELPLAVTAPSPFLVFGGLYALVNRFAWRWRLVQRVGLVRTPDLSGKWEGTLHSSYDYHGTPHPVRVSIEQTWSRICVRFSTASSRSHSVAATVLREGPLGVTIIYVYKNEPLADAIDPMHPHSGTACLSLTDEGELVGDYYSGRGRKNHGHLALTRNAPSAS